MSILSTENLGHTFSDKWLFKDLTFGLQKGDRIALVGINGTGKSTLLKIIASKIIPQEGNVVFSKDIKVGYLDQEPDFTGLLTIADFIYTLNDAVQQLIRAYESMIHSPNPDQQKLEKLIDQMTVTDAWNIEQKIKTILTRFDIIDFEQKIANLSGGQKKRLALAKLLIDDPDIYILDEPTNHLDIETIEWLEKMLISGQKTLLLVTHDRYFLDNVCTEIKELHQGKLYTYKGNYSYFLEKKAERALMDASTLEKNKNLLRKELEWMRRQPQARGTKSKARIDAFYDLEEKTKNSASTASLDLNVKVSRQGNKIAEIHHLSKAYHGLNYINNFSYIFKKGDRIGLAGKNGSGKTTFLNLITQEIKPDQGQIILGETTKIGYYKQGGFPFQTNQRVIDAVKEVAEYIIMEKGETISASQLLTHFLFPPEKQFGLIEKLSGGEKKRLQLMRILMDNPNFLILDEPTNDLDIDTLNILEHFLMDFPGVLVLVSHDRFLLDKLTNQLFIFEKGKPITIYNGNYSDYRLTEETKKNLFKEIPEKTIIEKKDRTLDKKKISFKEKIEYEQLEQEINTIEAQIKNKTKEMNQTTDHQLLIDLSKEIEQLTTTLDQKSNRWLTLAELI
ncbi:ABC-F family ATP-binding cassette domain-containing protein [Olivibacter ginsenosidimutans]|uniref:ABC-F family ATP-binding cassette domain-containing protein n=1 Tax=Olivibacter ginsenosidimutans TaxID=1176537 RepID=A0ABP9BZK4_9SPHI